MSKLAPELLRFARQQRKVDKAKVLILDGIIAEAIKRRCSLYDAAMEICGMLPVDKRDEWVRVSHMVLSTYEYKVKDEAWMKALYPGGK